VPKKSEAAKEIVQAWKAQQLQWGELFAAARRHSGRSLESVANEVGLATTTLTNWQRANSRFDPAYLDPLAQAVGASTLEWAGVFGFVPPYHMGLGRATETARRDLEIAQRRLQTLQLSGGATSAVVEAALSSGDWLVAVEGFVEGPDRCRLRTMDHVTISRADRRRVTADEIRRDPGLDAALSAAGAIRLTAAPWITGATKEVRQAADLADEWVWRIPRLNAQQVRAEDACPLSVPSVAVVSPLGRAGPGVGLSLGLGTVTATHEARLRVGDTFSDDQTPASVDAKQLAIARVAEELLVDRLGAMRGVIWSYAANRPAPDFLEVLGSERARGLVIYVRPTDALIEAREARARGFEAPPVWAKLRDEFDDAVAMRTGPTLTCHSGWPSDFDPSNYVPRELRNATYERSILIALRIIRSLHESFGGPALEALHRRAPLPLHRLAGAIESTVLDDPQTSLTRGRTFL
jgi:transcriptional regulator with XRE-family HTH domain